MTTPRPRSSLLAAIASALVLAAATVAFPEPAKMHGVGYAVSGVARACWEDFGKPVGCSSIDVSAHPWGPTGGTGRVAKIDGALYWQRYCARGPERVQNECFRLSPIGYYNDAWGRSHDTLGRAFEAGALGDRSRWDGDASTEEVTDFAVTTKRDTDLYRLYPPPAPPSPGPPAPSPAPVPAPAPQPPPVPAPAPAPAPQVCPACPTPPPPPAAVLRALERLEAAAALSRTKPVQIGPALRQHLKTVGEYLKREAMPGLPSTGGLDVRVVPGDGEAGEVYSP